MSNLNETESATPVNAMGGGGIATVDPLIKLGTIKRKPLPWAQQFKVNSPKYNHILPSNSPKRLRDIVGREIGNERRAAKRK